jgi:hypothetical protein
VPTLHLGVIDQFYQPPPTSAPKRIGKKPRRRRSARTISTGDVAEILEAKYHIFEFFWELHQGDIINYLTESYEGAMETFLLGGPLNLDPSGAATSKIEDRFKQMLSLRELDSLGYPGIPTAAAMAGKSSRFKSGYTKNRTPRPSFIDTGLLQSSAKAWIT